MSTVAARGGTQNIGENNVPHRCLNRPDKGMLGIDMDSTDSDESMTEDAGQTVAWGNSTEESDSGDNDGTMIRTSTSLVNENRAELRLMYPPPRLVQRRSAPSPGPLRDAPHTRPRHGSMKINPLPVAKGEIYDESGKSTYNDVDEEFDVKRGIGNQENLVRGLSPQLATFEERSGSPTSFTANQRNRHNPNYTDLAESSVPDVLEERIQAMRTRNAKENYHNRIPPEDAPPHMQMMVLLYQWAAWALEISDTKRREEMIMWVNGRFLNFMMSGGRVPGYDLKDLLEIAGVDPKELYGFGGDCVQPDNSMANMSSSRLAATISGPEINQPETDFEAAWKERSRGESGQRDGLPFAAQDASQSGEKERPFLEGDSDEDDEDEDEDDDDEHFAVIDSSPRQPISTNDDDTLRTSGKPYPTEASATVYETASAIANDRKRAATSDVEGGDQVWKTSTFGT
jgi:hypothetical protein